MASIPSCPLPLSYGCVIVVPYEDLYYSFILASPRVLIGRQRDWEILGASALQALDFNTSRKAFTRLRDLHLVDLVSEIEAKAMHEGDCLDPALR